MAQIDGPEAGLAILDRLDLDHYRYFHSTRAELRRRADRDDQAHHAYPRALDLAQTKPEQRFLAGQASRDHILRPERTRPRQHMMSATTDGVPIVRRPSTRREGTGVREAAGPAHTASGPCSKRP